MAKANDSLTKGDKLPPIRQEGWAQRLDRFSAASVRRPAAALLAVNLVLTMAGILLAGPDAWWSAGRELGLMTVASVVNLAYAAFLCLRIHRIADGKDGLFCTSFLGPRPARFIWSIMFLGFCFLALDEGLALHEKVEHAVNWTAGATGLGATDWIDDAIVASYGVAAAIVLWLFRDGLTWLWPQARWLAVAAALFVAMVALDMASGSQETVRALVGQESRIDLWPIGGRIDFVLVSLLGFAEEAIKLALGLVTAVILLMTYHRALQGD